MSERPRAVQVLPMNSKRDFQDYDDLKDVQKTWFRKEMVFETKGRYLYRKQGVKEEPGKVVLFQYEGQIIASARLDRVEQFSRPRRGRWHGALWFDPKSIKTFDPVDDEGIRRFWQSFKRFGQRKQYLRPAKNYCAFDLALTGVKPRRA
jgi:hypothetical protein